MKQLLSLAISHSDYFKIPKGSPNLASSNIALFMRITVRLRNQSHASYRLKKLHFAVNKIICHYTFLFCENEYLQLGKFVEKAY